MNLQIASSNSNHFSPLETLHVNSKKVSCEGGLGSSSHPLVYLNMGENDSVVCPYCSKNFTIKKVSQVMVGLQNQLKTE